MGKSIRAHLIVVDACEERFLGGIEKESLADVPAKIEISRSRRSLTVWNTGNRGKKVGGGKEGRKRASPR